MAAPSVKVLGLKELGRNLRRLDKATSAKALDSALLAAAEPVRLEASRLAPRSDTAGGTTGKGHAKDHIGKITVPHGPHDREAHIGPESDFWYLIFPEFGTPRQPALAPLRTAADSKFKEAVQEFREELDLQIRRAVR